jgi:hypothetical protein
MPTNSELRLARRLCFVILSLYGLSFALPVVVSEATQPRGYVYFMEGLKCLARAGVGADEGIVVSPAWFANFAFWFGCWRLYQARWQAAAIAGLLALMPSLLCGWVLMYDLHDDDHPGIGFYVWLTSMMSLALAGLYGSLCRASMQNGADPYSAEVAET